MGSELQNRKAAFERSCRTWSQDECKDIISTVRLGEAVYMDAVAYIAELEALIEAGMDDGK